MTDYLTDDERGDNWRFLLGDSGDRMTELADESVDFSVYSPPFQSLYTYSDSIRDMGNALDREDFFEQYAYMIRENLRITKPGRLAAVHVQQVSRRKNTDGYVGMVDFRGDVIRAYEAEGWIYWGEVCVDKDPQAQAIRTHAHALMFTNLDKDSSVSRPALADYLLVFKKPGDRPERIRQGDGHPSRVSHEEWIDWAQPIWWDIRETNTLNTAVAKEDADERHICPLQLDFIERCVRLWSNPGDIVLDPFGGIGSTGVVAIQQGRRSVSCELKPSYWTTAVRNLQAAEAEASLPSLFEEDA